MNQYKLEQYSNFIKNKFYVKKTILILNFFYSFYAQSNCLSNSEVIQILKNYKFFQVGTT